MNTDFNPTRKDLLKVDELILSLKNKKNKLVHRKVSVEKQLGDLNELYRSIIFNSAEFNAVKAKRASLKLIATGIELEIQSMNEELGFKNKLRQEVEFYLKNNKRPEAIEDFDRIEIKLKDLKKKYALFAKDRTRISSLRVMASEFIEELEKLLK